MRNYLNYAENESKDLGYTTMFLVQIGIENISLGGSA
jgi:hypothetical protein